MPMLKFWDVGIFVAHDYHGLTLTGIARSSRGRNTLVKASPVAAISRSRCAPRPTGFTQWAPELRSGCDLAQVPVLRQTSHTVSLAGVCLDHLMQLSSLWGFDHRAAHLHAKSRQLACSQPPARSASALLQLCVHGRPYVCPGDATSSDRLAPQDGTQRVGGQVNKRGLEV